MTGAKWRVRARAVGWLAVLGWAAVASAASLRIVSYNIAADINGQTTPRPGLTTVLEGIGNESTYTTARPIDVLTLQETTSNVTTVAPIVADLNTLYGADTYAMSPYQAPMSGLPGNGPNAIVYRNTLQLIASVGIGTPSSSGAPRQPVRYQFRPVGGGGATDFYVYVSHYKAGNTQTDRDRRDIEAQMIRTDAAALGASARILYTGDFNMYTSNEPAYQTLLGAGTGQGVDPLNRPGNWQDNASFQDIMTFSALNLHARFDFLLVTQNAMEDEAGLKYVAGSYHSFGVNGSTAEGDSVDLPSNTALPGLPNRAAVLTALTTASDHLPVVADFTIPSGVPAIALSANAFSRSINLGGSLPDDSFTVTNGGSGILEYTISESAGWLSVSPLGGTSLHEADTITISYDVMALSSGDYMATITVTDPFASNNPQAVNVTLHIGPASPDFNNDGDVDMGDFSHLQECLSDFPPVVTCLNADLNGDNLVGTADMSIFVNCLAGANRPPGC